MNFDTSGQMILFGGQGQDSRVFLSDTWSFAPPPNFVLVLEKLDPPHPRPGPSGSSSFVFDPCSGQMVLWVAHSRYEDEAEIWVFNVTTHIWKKLNTTNTPSYRLGAAMAFDPCNGLILMFGGGGPGFYSDETWVLNLKTETWTQLYPDIRPSPRAGSKMVFNACKGVMVLFGGINSSNGITYYNDTWTFNTSANTWNKLSISDSEAPPGQNFSPPAMTFDPCLGKVVLFDNNDIPKISNDVWTLNSDLTKWNRLEIVYPRPNLGHSAMAFNPCTGQDILYTWRYDDNPHRIWTFNALANDWTNLNSLILPPLILYNFCQMDFASSNGKMILYISNELTTSEVWTLSIGLASDLEAVESPLPPVHLKGFQQANKFATQTDYVNVLTWDPPSGGSSIVKYRIYRISQDRLLNKLIGEVSSEATLRFKDHNRTKGKTYTYSIVSEDELGAISAPTIVKIKGKVLS